MSDENSVLQFYGPRAYHDDVYVVGTKAGLEALLQAVTKALNTGGGYEESFVSDGEGFGIHVVLTNEETIRRLHSPYAADYAGDDWDDTKVWPQEVLTWMHDPESLVLADGSVK